MADENARLTPLGKLLSLVAILGLIGFGVYIVYQRGVTVKPGGGTGAAEGPETEAADTTGVTTVKEYK